MLTTLRSSIALITNNSLADTDTSSPNCVASFSALTCSSLSVPRLQLEYARFMDDMAIGADDIVEARKIIRDLDLTLQTRQLRLNSGKTKVLTSKEAHRYYRINENIALDKLETKLNHLIETSKNIDKYKDGVTRVICKGLEARVVR